MDHAHKMVLVYIGAGAGGLAAVATCTGLCSFFWKEYSRKWSQRRLSKNDEEAATVVEKASKKPSDKNSPNKHTALESSFTFGPEILEAFKGREATKIMGRRKKSRSEGVRLPVFYRQLA